MAAKATFLTADLSRTAAIGASSSTPVTGLDWTRLADPQPRHRTRVAATAAVLVLDLGAVTAFDFAGLISTNLTGTATVRVRTSATDSSCLTALQSDTGVLTGVTDPAWNGNVIVPLVPLVIPTPPLPPVVSARYLRWDISGANPIDIGLAPLGLLFRPTRNFSYGAQEGWFDPTTRETNVDTGAEFAVQLPQKRTRSFSMKGITQAEARAQFDAMDRGVGVGGDCLFIEDVSASQIVMAQNSIWGGFRPAADSFATRNFANVYSRDFKMLERL